jgi:hypothetical protein
MRSFGSRAFRMPLAVAVLVMSAACDNPVSPDEHPEAGGVVILDASSGAVLAMSVGANTAFDEPLTMTVSEVLEVEVKFLNADAPTNIALAFFPDASEGESLRVIIANPAIVEYDDHGDHGDFEAKAAGQTTAQFELMHGSHADFRSGLLTVIVE